MPLRKTLSLAPSLVAVVLTAGCVPTPAAVCSPGQSVACAGPGGCTGGQVCRQDGSGYGLCDCGGGDGGSGGTPPVCTPGATRCQAGTLSTCTAAGTGETSGTCASGACQTATACLPQACTPGATRCQTGTLFTCDATGTGETSGSCASGACQTGTACLPQACPPGATRCQTGTLFTCNASGTGEVPASCASGSCQTATACVPQTCSPGATRCVAGTVFTCNSSGTGETSGSCASGVCQTATACLPQSCTPGAVRCQTGTLFTCNGTGTAESSASCPSGLCQTASACRPQTCTPGATRCQSGTLFTCNAGGTGETSGLCASGTCQTATACLPQSCTPGAVRCQTGTLFTCNGTGTAESSASCASGLCQTTSACLPQTCTPTATRCQSGALFTCNASGTGETSAACSAPANASPTCGAGACGFTCNAGFTTCGSACCPVSTVMVSAIAAGCYHTCALTSSGGVKCWGDNTNGQLGDTTTTGRPTPADVTGLTSGVQAVSAGCYHTCALTTGGGLKCWGANNHGQLGDGTSVDRHAPVDVSGLTANTLGVSGGGLFSCAVLSGGTVRCWGDNSAGQLGIGSLAAKSAPVDVVGLDAGIQSVSTGGYHACAVTTGAGVKCWGKGTSGQLGDKTTSDSWTPVDTFGLGSGVQSVRAGSLHTCAQLATGGSKCWGYTAWGQTGNPYVIGGLASEPVSVVGLDGGVLSLTPGSDRDHNCAVTTGGGAQCWGRNNFGQLGNNAANTSAYPAPQSVVGLSSGIQAVAAGAQHSCAVTTAGGVKCWGDNSSGQLGDGTKTDHHVPVDVVFP